MTMIAAMAAAPTATIVMNFLGLRLLLLLLLGGRLAFPGPAVGGFMTHRVPIERSCCQRQKLRFPCSIGIGARRRIAQASASWLTQATSKG